MVSSFEKTFLFEYRDFGSVEFGKIFELLLLFQLRASRIHFRILGRNSGLT